MWVFVPEPTAVKVKNNHKRYKATTQDEQVKLPCHNQVQSGDNGNKNNPETKETVAFAP